MLRVMTKTFCRWVLTRETMVSAGAVCVQTPFRPHCLLKRILPLTQNQPSSMQKSTDLCRKSPPLYCQMSVVHKKFFLLKLCLWTNNRNIQAIFTISEIHVRCVTFFVLQVRCVGFFRMQCAVFFQAVIQMCRIL